MSIRTYKRRPVTVDAALVTEDDIGAIAGWCAGRLTSSGGSLRIMVPTPGKDTPAREGDYVVRHTSGAWEVVDAETFETEFCYAEHGTPPKPKTLSEVFFGA